MSAVNKNFKFRKYSVNDGLSQNVVYSVNQDNRGFIWICTQQGLNRFDGREFRVYRNDPENKKSIFNDLVYSSYFSKEGEMWFGSINGGFFKYVPDENNFINYRIPVGLKTQQSKLLIFDIKEDENGSMYIAAFGAGVFKFTQSRDKYSIERMKLPDNQLLINPTKLNFDADGNLWIGTWDNGLFKYNFKKDILENFSVSNKNNLIINNRIRSLFRDSQDVLWAVTQTGILKYNHLQNKFSDPLTNENAHHNLGNYTFTSIEEDKHNKLWIGTSSSGLIYFDPVSNEILIFDSKDDDADSISGNSVLCLFNDRSNVLWAGTFDDGLNKTDCERKKFYNLGHILNKYKKKISVLSICVDKNGMLFVGAAYDDLLTINISEGEIKKEAIYLNGKKLPDRQTVTCIYCDCEGNVYYCLQAKGIFKYCMDPEKTEHFNFPNPSSECTVFSIAEFDKDNLWIGTREFGLLLFNKRTGKFKRAEEIKNIRGNLTNAEIKVLLKDRMGNLWIGTDVRGLNYLDLGKRKVINFTNNPGDKNTISENYVSCLCEDNDGNLWIGTINRGLNKFIRKTNSFKRFTTDNGLPDNTIRAIENDIKGNLWISTNNGISRFNIEKETFKNYENGDGLQSREFNDRSSFKTSDGILYFGSINGINFFNPDEIKDNPYLPGIALTDFKLFNKSVKNSANNPYLKKNITETELINLSYKESVISFEFASLIFNNVSKNKYAYKLEGFDKDWTYCGKIRFATYTSIAPGDYVFRVKGSNNDDLWSEDCASVSLSISPPYWKTWWFKMFGVLSAASITGLTYSRKLNKIRQEKKAQEEFSRKLLESRENERKKISSGLHNTIAHDILITKNKAEIAMKNMNDPSKMYEALKQISENTSTTLNDLRGITYNLHPHQLERLGLTKAIKSIINNVEKSTEIKFTAYIENLDNIFSPDLEINIYRVVQECLNNIIKHSDASESFINISKKENVLYMMISDNGKGIRKDFVKGIGMNELNERIKLYEGALNIESNPGKGTTLNISIPINLNHEK
ncbi:MAG: hypothetical protein HGGPFJEG_00368 [Ignavibacteria bacterium]|nr:hypothetical protein [Ignavibacteria bacterium]